MITRTELLLLLGAGIMAAQQSPEGLRPVRSFEFADWAYDIAISPDSRLLAAIGANHGLVRIWDVNTGQLLGTDEYMDTLTSVAFHPNGSRIAVTAKDGTVMVQQVPGLKTLSTLKAHKGPAVDVTFTPDGSMVLSAGLDSSLGFWEYSTGPAGFKSAPQVEVAAGGDLPRTDMTVIRPGVAAVAYASDGKRIAVGYGTGTVKILTPTGEGVVYARGHTQGIHRVAFSPDGSRLATASQDRTARIWDAGTGNELYRLRGYLEWVLCVSFSADGKYIAVGSRDKSADIWEVSSGRRILQLPSHPTGVWGVRFSPNGKWLATATYGGAVYVWDVAAVLGAAGVSPDRIRPARP